MEIYMLPYTIRSRDVNMFQRMRSSQLFELLQEAATDHSELLSAGVDVIPSEPDVGPCPAKRGNRPDAALR